MTWKPKKMSDPTFTFSIYIYIYIYIRKRRFLWKRSEIFFSKINFIQIWHSIFKTVYWKVAYCPQDSFPRFWEKVIRRGSQRIKFSGWSGLRPESLFMQLKGRGQAPFHVFGENSFNFASLFHTIPYHHANAQQHRHYYNKLRNTQLKSHCWSAHHSAQATTKYAQKQSKLQTPRAVKIQQEEANQPRMEIQKISWKRNYDAASESIIWYHFDKKLESKHVTIRNASRAKI